ncbi:MAG: LPS-assembly protein LptD [Chitinophagaceae bacterium]|nr:LPS-assembly protein LptD [Chitinophagaceae bacterium]
MGFVALIYTHACITPFAANASGTFRSLLTYQQKDTIPVRTQSRDSTVQRVDTFKIKRSADTLDAPLKYEAEDSAVVTVKDKKVLLYGKTKTTYTDMVLTAPRVEVDQRTQIVTAVRSVDSAGNTLDAANFKTGDSEMTNDTIRYNFKTQVGVTKKTYTQQGEILVIGEQAKKVNANTTFIRSARFTTCMLDEPHFAFVAGKMKVINQKLAVSGPAHPEFEGVPVPIYLPFGFYPLSQGRHSGMLRPNFITDERRGIGIQEIGYYKVINDHWDVKWGADVFSYGEWATSIGASYRTRYRYNGGLTFNFRSSKQNFKGDPDFSSSKVFNISWSHAVDSRARPGVTFSANVNAGSTKYNQSIPGNAILPFQNIMGSSINFSKNWKNKPYNLSLSATHSQNNNLGLINLSLPNGAFTVNTIFPFQQKEGGGTTKWYEKLGIGYTGNFYNNVSFYDTLSYGKNGIKPFLKYLLDTAQWGATHAIPITLSLPPILGGKVIVSPGVSYNQVWLQRLTRYQWNQSLKKVDTLEKKGVFIDQRASFSLGLNTALYGMYQFKKSKIIAIRHVIRPQLSFAYTPDLNSSRIRSTKVDTTGRVLYYNEIGGQVLYNTSSRRSGAIQFGVDNNLEMKYRSKKDTGKAAIKKVMILEGFGFNASYDLLRDSMRLSRDIPLYVRTTLFDKININAGATLNPYQLDAKGNEINKLAWQGGKFSLGRITAGNVSIGTNFQSKPKDPKKEELKKKQMEDRLRDPVLAADQQRLLEYMQQNPNEFVDFNIDWQVNISYSLSFYSRLRSDFSGFDTEFTNGMNVNGSFNLTPKWKFSGSASVDVKKMDIQYMTFSVNRDLHCWQLAINVIPIGFTRSFNFTVSPKAGILQDLRINRTRFFTGY